MQTVYFTQKGLQDKQKEYADLLNERPAAVADLTKAREMGDLSENGYYKSARFKLSDIDRRLRQLKHLLKIAKVKENTHGDIVDIGSRVTISDGEKEKTYEIVGTYEANPSEGKISASSPLGRSLLGKRKGDKALFSVGERQTTYYIVKIHETDT